MKKISVLIAKRHATSLSLEEEFYNALIHIAKERNLTVNQLVTEIDKERTAPNLSSAIRIYILNTLLQKLNRT